jgi:hypothetical protein
MVMITEKAAFIIALRKFMAAGISEAQVINIVHQEFVASLSPARWRVGQSRHVPQRAIANVASEPSLQQRKIAFENSRRLAVTILDTFRVRDGRPIGDVRFGEVERLRAANAIEASIFAQIKEFANAPHAAKIRDIIKPSQFQRIHQRAAEAADAT